jgi:hypothetical protein
MRIIEQDYLLYESTRFITYKIFTVVVSISPNFTVSFRTSSSCVISQHLANGSAGVIELAFGKAKTGILNVNGTKWEYVCDRSKGG